MSGKGDTKRPTQVDEQTFSDNWERVFGHKLVGRSSTVEPESLKFSDVRSNRTAPATHEVSHGNASKPTHGFVAKASASSSTDGQDGKGSSKASLIYVDDSTGQEVSEEWWPGDHIEPNT